jgi:tRNA (cytidine32/uridine32-2'-O)-methyltransferase
MKNMALERLCLVAPREFPSAEATARASGADDVLAAAQLCATLEEAVADCVLVIGASTRQRAIEFRA